MCSSTCQNFLGILRTFIQIGKDNWKVLLVKKSASNAKKITNVFLQNPRTSPQNFHNISHVDNWKKKTFQLGCIFECSATHVSSTPFDSPMTLGGTLQKTDPKMEITQNQLHKLSYLGQKNQHKLHTKSHYLVVYIGNKLLRNVGHYYYLNLTYASTKMPHGYKIKLHFSLHVKHNQE